jgi:ATP phosphoribosyltransferase
MRIGLPKGRFEAVSRGILAALGVVDPTAPTLRFRCGPDDVLLLKAKDIPGLVAAGVLDAGVAPSEWVAELGAGCAVHGRVPGYQARIALLEPRTGRPPGDRGVRVATEFPALARRHLPARDLTIIEVHGSTEAFAPDLAHAVVDCVETGMTAARHGLREVRTLQECCLQVVSADPARTPRADLDRLLAACLPPEHAPAAEPAHRPETADLAAESALVPLHSYPPFLRAALLPMARLDRPFHLDGLGEVALAHSRGAAPAYLVLWDRSTQLRPAPGVDRDRLAAGLDAWLAAGGLRGEAYDLHALLGLMDTWDELVRELPDRPGPVYLASERAVRRLHPLAGLPEPGPDQIEGLLLEAQSLELIDRFPVAFADGGVTDNQCRLNDWGRRLLRTAAGDPVGALERARWRARLRTHLEANLPAYRELVAAAPAGDQAGRADQLPVPLLR